MKKRMIAVACTCFLLGRISFGDTLNEDFSTLPSIATSKTVQFSGSAALLDSDPFLSSPTSLLLDAWGAGTGGGGWAEAYYDWDLGSDMDFWNEGNGRVSLQLNRSTTARDFTVLLLDSSSNVVATSGEFVFFDSGVWHDLTIPLSGDETAVRYVRFINQRSSGSSASRVNVDNFVVTDDPSGIIFEDIFTTLPDVPTNFSVGAFAWQVFELDDDPYISAPTSLKLSGGGGDGAANAFFLWDIGGVYDFYSGGFGSVTVQVSRFSSARHIDVELRDATTTNLVSTYRHVFDDFNTWHDVVLPLDGDETSVGFVQFIVNRSSGSSSCIVNVEDFIASGPLHSPSTILSLSSFSGDVFKMVVDCPTPATSYPKVKADLVSGSWGDVGHSTNSVGPFSTNNLGSVSGTNTIYLESSDATAFFGIGEE